jgi:hypothetical protein
MEALGIQTGSFLNTNWKLFEYKLEALIIQSGGFVNTKWKLWD